MPNARGGGSSSSDGGGGAVGGGGGSGKSGRRRRTWSRALGAAAGALPPVVFRPDAARATRQRTGNPAASRGLRREHAARLATRQFGPVTNIKYMAATRPIGARRPIDLNVEDAVKAFSQQHTFTATASVSANNRTSAPPSAKPAGKAF